MLYFSMKHITEVLCCEHNLNFDISAICTKLPTPTTSSQLGNFIIGASGYEKQILCACSGAHAALNISAKTVNKKDRFIIRRQGWVVNSTPGIYRSRKYSQSGKYWSIELFFALR